jgi:hypothetical protein
VVHAGTNPFGCLVSVRAYWRSDQPIALRMKKSGSLRLAVMQSKRSWRSVSFLLRSWLRMDARRTHMFPDIAQERIRSDSVSGCAVRTGPTKCAAISST